MMGNDMKFTGERMIPGQVDRILLQEHVARYKFALGYSNGLKVLDAACGAGYGSYILASKAEHVTGADIAGETIDFANDNFHLNNTDYITADVLNMPFDNESFDLSVAFEIFEHLENPEKLLYELKRVTKKNGRIILSTPNVAFVKSTVDNPFHTHEYDFTEFSSAINTVFPDGVEYFSQIAKSGSSGIKQAYMKFKKNLGIGPLLGKQNYEISNPVGLLALHTPYNFPAGDLNNAEFFIAVISCS
ncbi:class I SAM-dependent methyltransferase [bacterium]|nr:class I SAM-dependent methyltransferase [bacterium]